MYSLNPLKKIIILLSSISMENNSSFVQNYYIYTNTIIFAKGFVLGFLINDMFNKIQTIKKNKTQQKNNCSIKSIHFISHIKDHTLFNDTFPDYTNVYKVQPGWNYFNKKNSIKINLGNEIVNYLNTYLSVDDSFEFTYDQLFNLKEFGNFLIDIDINLFKIFGDGYIYINYLIDNKEFINVYTQHDEILSSQFQYYTFQSNELVKVLLTDTNYQDQKEDITEYYKMFLNNDAWLTPEQILLNYDSLNKNIEETKLKINYRWKTEIYSFDEKIKLI